MHFGQLAATMRKINANSLKFYKYKWLWREIQRYFGRNTYGCGEKCKSEMQFWQVAATMRKINTNSLKFSYMEVERNVEKMWREIQKILWREIPWERSMPTLSSFHFSKNNSTTSRYLPSKLMLWWFVSPDLIIITSFCNRKKLDDLRITFSLTCSSIDSFLAFFSGFQGRNIDSSCGSEIECLVIHKVKISSNPWYSFFIFQDYFAVQSKTNPQYCA